MFCYHNPVAICFDTTLESALETLPQKLLLVTSKSFENSGVVARAKQCADIVQVMSTIPQNPELAFLQNLKASLQPHSAIIAIGGGNVIDSAKFLRVRGEVVLEYSKLEIHNKQESTPLFVLPTTAGSGSELTPWATIWDKANNQKYSLHDSCLFPTAAYYDCALTLSLPRLQTIYSALDCLSHAFESVWNKNANPIATMHALAAINLTFETLPNLVQNLADLFLRRAQMLASMHAALAFCSTQTALAHAISYPLTMQLGLPHGLACSFTLPMLLRHCEEPAKTILLPFAERLEQLFEILNISTNPHDYGVSKAFATDIFETLNARAANARLNVSAVRKEFIKFCIE